MTFSEEKAAFRWDSNPRLTLSRRDALPTEQPRQLSWLSSKSPIQTKAKQSKARRASQPDEQVNSNLGIKEKAGIIKPPKTPNFILSDVHEYSNTQNERKRERKTSNTTQHKT